MSDNPLLEKLQLPGRIFQLPSKGIFYTNGELDPTVKNGEIHVHPMSSIDEIHMKNPDQLFSGAAVDIVFSRCISGISKPSQLLSKDVDAILLYLRTVTYGPSFEIIAKHTCEGAKEHTYIADIDQIIANIEFIDTTIVDKVYNIKLPNGQTVNLHPTIYQNTIDFVRENGSKQVITAKDQEKNLLSVLLGVIKSVDNISDPQKIEQWLRALPSPQTNVIGSAMEKINNWGSDLSWTCRCRDCGEEFSVEIPINPVAFFTE